MVVASLLTSHKIKGMSKKMLISVNEF